MEQQQKMKERNRQEMKDNDVVGKVSITYPNKCYEKRDTTNRASIYV
jgi:hypothetical protein